MKKISSGLYGCLSVAATVPAHYGVTQLYQFALIQVNTPGTCIFLEASATISQYLNILANMAQTIGKAYMVIERYLVFRGLRDA